MTSWCFLITSAGDTNTAVVTLVQSHHCKFPSSSGHVAPHSMWMVTLLEIIASLDEKPSFGREPRDHNLILNSFFVANDLRSILIIGLA